MSTCSESSLLAGEPIAGSAVANTWRFLGLEYRGRWEAHAVEQAAFPPAARAAVDAFQALPGTRVQLIRRPRRKGPLQVVFADTTPGAERVRRLQVPSLEALGDVDLSGLMAGTAAVGEPDPGPLLWVCANGRRDACCARYGAQLFYALDELLGESVWETTHLGGHRFAATLLWLPEGLSLGRLRAEDAPRLVGAVRRGEVLDVERLRGRTAWPPEVQAAEAAVRADTGVRRAGGMRWLGSLVGGDRVQVRLEVDGYGERVVEMTKQPLPLRRTSCSKEPVPGVAWRAA